MSFTNYVLKLEELEKMQDPDQLDDELDREQLALLDEINVLRRGPRETVLAMAQCFEDVVGGSHDISTYTNSVTNVKVRAERTSDRVVVNVFLPACFGKRGEE